MRHYIARWLRRAANRLDPTPSYEAVIRARTVKLAENVPGATVCPHCGIVFFGTHACWSVYEPRDTTATPLPWPGSTWTVKTSNGASA